MYTEDSKLILCSMAEMYPEPLDLDSLYRLTGIDDTRARLAMWGLVERGFIDLRGSPSWIGLSWSQPRLSEAGMAVASGLASLHEDSRVVIKRLEAKALSQLDELRNSSDAICSDAARSMESG